MQSRKIYSEILEWKNFVSGSSFVQNSNKKREITSLHFKALQNYNCLQDASLNPSSLYKIISLIMSFLNKCYFICLILYLIKIN